MVPVRPPVPALLLLLSPLAAQVETGIDVVAADGHAALRGRKCGLITNHTGLTRDGRRTIDVLRGLEGMELLAIFSPEHGLQGALDRDGIAHGTDEPTGLPVWSLYGETRRPTAAMLQGLDTLVFDVQDIGCRFYTYVSTMGLCLEAAAEHGLRFVVLDRPNPLGGERVEGPLLSPGQESFVGHHTVALRHGMTAGELMRMFVGEKGLQLDAQVVPCRGYERWMTYADTGLLWVDPSPNMRSLTQALLYPGIGLLEGTNLSVGRGTDRPFELLGAPWCDGRELGARLRDMALPGVAFVPVVFTPAASRFAQQRCHGIDVAITDWRTFEPVRTGLAIACVLRDSFGASWRHERLLWLLRNPEVYEAFAQGASHGELVARLAADEKLFRLRRRPFLIYP